MIPTRLWRGSAGAQYRYSNYIDPNDKTVEVRRSLYLIRIGALQLLS